MARKRSHVQKHHLKGGVANSGPIKPIPAANHSKPVAAANQPKPIPAANRSKPMPAADLSKPTPATNQSKPIPAGNQPKTFVAPTAKSAGIPPAKGSAKGAYAASQKSSNTTKGSPAAPVVQAKGSSKGSTAAWSAKPPQPAQSVQSKGISKGPVSASAPQPMAAVKGPAAPPAAQQKLKGTILMWNGSYGWILPESKIDNPKINKHGGKLYLNKDNIESVLAMDKGTKVEFILYEDVSGLGADKVCSVNNQSIPVAGKGKGATALTGGPPNAGPKAVSHPGQTAAQNSAQKAAPSGKGTAKGAGGSAAASSGKPIQGAATTTGGVKKTIEKPPAPAAQPPAALQKPLPPDWEEHWSDEHQIPYYWNRVTKESRWVRPFPRAAR